MEGNANFIIFTDRKSNITKLFGNYDTYNQLCNKLMNITNFPKININMRMAMEDFICFAETRQK